MTKDVVQSFIALICRDFSKVHPCDEEVYFRFVAHCSKMKERQYDIPEHIKPLMKQYSLLEVEDINRYIRKFKEDLCLVNFIMYGCSMQTYLQRKQDCKRYIEDIEQFLKKQ